MNIQKFKNPEEFKEWLKTKPDDSYSYTSIDNCCMAQWAKYCGGKDISAGGFSIYHDKTRTSIPELYLDALFDSVTNTHADRFSIVLNNLSQIRK